MCNVTFYLQSILLLFCVQDILREQEQKREETKEKRREIRSMASIDKLQIRGIRAFSPLRDETIE